MFKLTIHDRNGVELKEGDFVKVFSGGGYVFFSEVKYDDKEGYLYPFHTFSFHSVEKVDKVPENAILSNEERYRCWFLDELEEVNEDGSFNKYLTSWRECEIRLEKSCFRIQRLNVQQKLF